MHTLMRKALVVDDDPVALEMISRHLHDGGFDVVKAQSAKEAWELLTHSAHNFSLIVSDRMMPEMDGIALTRKIKAQPAFRNIPIVMLTSAAEKEEVIAAVKEGVYDFLLKPVEKDLLLLVVNRALSDCRGD